MGGVGRGECWEWRESVPGKTLQHSAQFQPQVIHLNMIKNSRGIPGWSVGKKGLFREALTFFGSEV